MRLIRIKLISYCIVLITSIQFANAQRATKLPLFFSDSMILQRDADVNIWGTDSASIKVVVTGSWNVKDSTITDANGNWRVKLQTPAAGGPYTLTAKGSTTKTISNILMGEVWFCSGQSNMEMPMKGYLSATPLQLVDSADYFIANSLNTNIRVFKPGWNPVSPTPVSDFTSGRWIAARPSSTPEFSATAYFFARKIQEKLGVPVGIMVSARGGSKIEAWLDSATLATVRPVVVPSVLDWQTAHITDVQLFNTFLHPFIGYTIKGAIWSQGESNIGTGSYQELFTKMIASWRTKWGIGNFPFYFAQVAPSGNNTDFNAARLREAQLNTMLLTPNTGMACTMDIGVQDVVHYPKKKVVGDRLADWALIKNYGFSGTPTGPIFKSLTIKNDTINLRFDYTGNGLTSLGLGLSDFEIAGANRVFFPATVTTANFNFSLNVKSSSVATPLYVRYGFKNWVQGSLFNTNAQPVSSFRTEQLQDIYTLLPVVFGEINVAQQNQFIIVSWNSLEEINVKNYEVEQSFDGENFKTIATVVAKGNNTKYSYHANTSTQNPIKYFRIKVVDKDGTLNYSKIVKLKISSTPSEIKILNTTKNQITLFFTNSFTGNVVLNSVIGQTISITKVSNKTGLLQLVIPTLAKGVYQFTFTNQKDFKTSKSFFVF